MKYNFDEIIDRRHAKYSYSTKWSKSQIVADMLGVKAINDDTLALYTADMDFRCAPKILEAMHHVADHGIFGYSGIQWVDGYYASIINWFKRRHHWAMTAAQITYVDGTVEAIKLAIRGLTQEGDGVIIQRPVYYPFSTAITRQNRVILNNQLKMDEAGYYTIDFEDLERKAADPRAKLMLLCNPHNPVGRNFTANELQQIYDICQRHDIIVFADEIHGDLIRNGEVFIPIATVVTDHSHLISATAVNKTFNLAGLHCTHIVIQEEKLNARYKACVGNISPSPFTIAAVMAAYDESEDWVDELNCYLDDNIQFVLDFLRERMPLVKCRRPEGTYILWLDFRGYGLSDAEIHERIYSRANVLLEDGTMFDPDEGQGFQRICVPSPRSLLKEALERIAEQF